MNSNAKGEKVKPKRLVSDGADSPNTRAPSVSGAYIYLAQKGELQRVTKLRTEYSVLTLELSEIEKSLRECNDPNWLDEFAKRLSRKGKSFHTALPSHVTHLERRKTQAVARRNKVFTKIQEIEVRAPEGTFTTLAIPPDKQAFSQTLQSLPIGSNSRIHVRIRDETIRKYAHLSDKEICLKLDAELMQRDSPTVGFPDSWREDFKLSKFADAYAEAKCRPRLQKLISKAKRGF